jgi:hypothetical protein
MKQILAILILVICLLPNLEMQVSGQVPGTSQYPTSLDTATTLMTQVNACSTTLNGGINNSVTSITVNTQTCFPATGIFVIDTEYMIYTASTSTSFTVTRAAFGSAAATHSSGAAVRMTVMAAYHNVLKDAMIAVQTKLGTGASIDASKIGGGSVSSTEFDFLNGVTSGIQSQIDAKVSFDINGLTAETSIAAGDFVAIYDVSAGALRKMTRSDFVAGLSGSGATAQLDNLSSVSINATLGFQTTLSIGSTTTPPQFVFLYGGGTYGSHSFRIGGTPTGHRQLNLPDASTTLLGTDTAATVSNKTIDNSNTFSGYYDVARISAPSNPGSGNLRLFANNGTGKLACLDNSGADCMPSAGGGSGTVNTGASTALAYYPSAGTTVDDVPGSAVDVRGGVTVAPTAATSGSPNLFTITGPTHTTLTVAEFNDVNFNFARTVQFASGGGTISLNRGIRVQSKTLTASTNGITVTDNVGLHIATDTCSTNVTCTRNTGLMVQGTNNADDLAFFNHKILSTGDVLALGLVSSKVVRFISNAGTINSVFNATGSSISSSATDGMIWVPEYSGTGAPTGTPTSYSGSNPCYNQRDNINAVYTTWCYMNSAWRDIGGQFKRWDTGSGNGAQTINFNSSTSGVVSRQFTLSGGNATFTFSNPPPTGTQIALIIIQDGTGSRTATWPGSVKWVGGTAPTLTTTASAKDLFHFIWDGTNYQELGRALDVK